MKSETSNPDLQTIYSRIDKKDINLQPDFQRGEIWSITRQKKLIDSILRGWKIPPIHVIESSNCVDEVLDGQQRLVAIRDFYENKFPIDGHFEPLEPFLLNMHGCYYSDLSSDITRKLDKYSLTVIRLSEYSPEEPRELFYRLNQPASLTAAEQRNAFIGETRTQIKKLSAELLQYENISTLIGFSNSRLAYDEIISKLCYAIEEKTLQKKITANDISEKFRTNSSFSGNTIDSAKNAISKLLESMSRSYIGKFTFNKATLFSWLIFSYRHNTDISGEEFTNLVTGFEENRLSFKNKSSLPLLSIRNYGERIILPNFFEQLFLIYNQRASMGSTDAYSIIIRDLILELFYSHYFFIDTKVYLKFNDLYTKHSNLTVVLDELINELGWGEL